jgi:phosphoglycolate phosphatase-like HAD superfamily hydrolase
VLLDWNGTIAAPPVYTDLVAEALTALGRPADPAAVAAVLDALRGAQTARVDDPAVDLEVAAHRAAYLGWYRDAGLDDPLALALYVRVADPAEHRFAADAGALLAALHDAGVRVGVLSTCARCSPRRRCPTVGGGTRWSTRGRCPTSPGT